MWMLSDHVRVWLNLASPGSGAVFFPVSIRLLTFATMPWMSSSVHLTNSAWTGTRTRGASIARTDSTVSSVPPPLTGSTENVMTGPTDALETMRLLGTTSRYSCVTCMGMPHVLADQRADVPTPSGLRSRWVTSLSPGNAFIQFVGSLRKENTVSTGALIVVL